MKVLIVDDSYDKVPRILDALTRASIEARIEQETTAAAARRRLMAERFDLLLVDLRLPETAGNQPIAHGGLAFVDLLAADSRYPLPGEILFVTADPGIALETRSRIDAMGLSAVATSGPEASWVPTIIGKARMAQHRARSASAFSCDVALLTALGTPEFDALLELPYSWSEFRITDDPTVYRRGKVAAANGEYSVIAACAFRKGMSGSAALATKLALRFRPKLLIMTGICAGVKGKTSLGDVVIGDPTWDWGSGKQSVDGDGNSVFNQAPVQRPLNTHLVNLCSEISRSRAFASSVRAGWQGKLPEGQFKCHVGPMASGASVVADGSVARTIADQNRELLAIEMESFAVMAACELAATPPPIGLAIKSVCDFADAKKGDDWQTYASYTSARFADEIIRVYFAKQ